MKKKSDFYGVVAQARDMVPGFQEGYRKFEQHVVLNGLSEGMLENYGCNVAHLALHFGRSPESVSVEEINVYLYHKSVKKTQKNTLKTGESEKNTSENSLQRSHTEHPSMIETT